MGPIRETLQPEMSYRVRQFLGPGINQLAQLVGQPEFELRETEYVGTIRQPLDEFTEHLETNGFEWDPLAWYHRPPVGSEPNGSWTYQTGLFADRQLHVILIAHSPAYIDVFAHEEYNWLRHPLKHVRQVGIEREAGRDQMRRWVESQDIEIATKSRRKRRFSYKLATLAAHLGGIVTDRWDTLSDRWL